MEKSSLLTENDLKHLELCLSLAKEALDAGDEPFGSILVNEKNQVIATARNRVNELNILAHPEIELTQWAAENLTKAQLKNTIMYTTGEHCPMCAAAHGWAGIANLVYLSSGTQLGNWLAEFDVSPAPILFIPVKEIIKNVEVKGPATGDLVEQIKEMHKAYHLKK